LKQRIITGLIAGAAFIALLFLGGNWFTALIVLLSMIGYDEYLRMNGLRNYQTAYIIGLMAMLFIILPISFDQLSVSSMIWILTLLLLTITVITKNKVTIDQMAQLLLGVIYLGFGFHYMIFTRLMDPHGLFWTLLILACIWATDSGAYFSGMAFGKHLLWPAISPKKTIEGALGGLILSVIIAICFSLVHPELITIVKALGLGIIIAVVGQMGDLIQSAYKRVKGVKDTGAILPGHGGVLDRVDSWLIVFPFVHFFSVIVQ
jgi:phosphatidate cytidylyltransferase